MQESPNTNKSIDVIWLSELYGNNCSMPCGAGGGFPPTPEKLWNESDALHLGDRLPEEFDKMIWKMMIVSFEVF